MAGHVVSPCKTTEPAMLFRTLLSTLFCWVVAVTAQTSQYCSYGRCLETFFDPVYGVKYGIALPISPSTTNPNELIGQIDAPASAGAKWLGISLGGQHNYVPLIVAWPNPSNTDIVFSTRQAYNYGPPTPYIGPIITTIAKSFTPGGGWRWTFRCQSCLSWNNVGPGGPPGSIDPSGVTVFAYAFGASLPLQPSNPASWLDMAQSFHMWGHFMMSAQTALYSTYFY